MTRKNKILSIVGTVIGLFMLYFVVNHIRFISTDDAQIEAHTVLLAPKVSGFVASVKVIEGQKVKAGDVLIELDDSDYQNALRQIQGDLTSFEARKRDTEKNFRRLSELFSSGAVSQQQYDTASTAFSEAKAKFDAISAQVAQAQLNIANAKIKAPSDGFIAKKSVEIGQLAVAGTPLIGFVDATERWIDANFKETDIEKIKIGAKVEVDVDAVGGRNFTGKVESISAATGSTFSLLPPDNATGNFTKVVQRVPVKIVLEGLTPADIELLRAGLSVVVSVHKF